MKAGTAQKMILNMISTSLMIKYGKVYKNLMVDVQPTNEKLVERAKRIIVSSSGCSYDEAASFLKQSDSNVKIAICMALTGLSCNDCGIILNKKRGNISKAIRSLKEGNDSNPSGTVPLN
jgi:N-acetylmuramic acid 6-phosphate etherase